MLRILCVQRGQTPEEEFILLQNQGVLKVCLTGFMLTEESVVRGGREPDPSRTFVFWENIWMPPNTYAIVVTGKGEDGWRRCRDGTLVYHAFWNRDRVVWSTREEPIHLLGIVHTKAPEEWQKDPSLVLRGALRR
jgi:hypothetical protein